MKPFVKLPVARDPIGSERLDVGALLLLTIGLPWGLSLDVNAGAAALGQRHPEGFLPQGVASGSLSWAVTERLSTITELFFATKDERDSRANLRTTVGGPLQAHAAHGGRRRDAHHARRPRARLVGLRRVQRPLRPLSFGR